MNNKIPDNNTIFNELEELTSIPGFIHLICYLDFFSNSIFYEENKGLTAIEINELMERELPIRSEICILIGLLCKHGIFDTTPLSKKDFSQLEKKTLLLLKELQSSQISFNMEQIENKNANYLDFANGALKENILYGGESFYDFQYIDFAPKKYLNDSNWFIDNKDYSLEELIAVIHAVNINYHENITNTFDKLHKQKIKRIHKVFDDLSSHTLNLEFISKNSNVDIEKVFKVLDSFLYDFTSMNSTFLSDSDFNLTNAYPIFKVNEKYILLSRVNLYEALYETPFFWFMEDKQYRDKASKNRGSFTEQFSKECLEKVFGTENVFTNINIEDYSKEVGRKKGDNIVGEIDVLVTYANKAIILQAKSKKLTIEARKGNFRAINNDFKNAIQDSYDQGYSCSELIQNKKLKLIKEDGTELKTKRDFDDIFIICAISDHYPSLSVQVREMLSYNTTNVIHEPFIMDIFLLDVISEILSTPLYFVDYLFKRAATFSTIHAQNELVVLGYHLSSNLMPDEKFDLLSLHDDIASSLDAAMIVRRRNYPGEKIPEGILTYYRNTFFGSLISLLEKEEKYELMKLGLFLLSLASKTIEEINENVEYLIIQNSFDKKGHSITLGFTNNVSTGIIFHTNHVEFIYAKRYFRKCFEHMIKKHKFTNNYGIYFDSNTKEIKDIKSYILQ
jgi:hypothetical protein